MQHASPRSPCFAASTLGSLPAFGRAGERPCRLCSPRFGTRGFSPDRGRRARQGDRAPRPAQRIFSTALAVNNVLLALVEPERVVGVTRFAQDPEQSYVVDKLRDHMVILDSLNAELVVATNPDIVLAASWNNPDEVRLIEDLGYPVYIFTGFSTVQDALDLVRRVGEITGEDEAAAQLIDTFWQQYADIARRIEGRERPAVLVWDTWSTTTGLNTSMHDIIEMAGGINLAAVHGIEGWQTIDAEAIIAMAPEVIVTYESEEFVERVLNDPALQSVPTVQSGRVYTIDHTRSRRPTT